MGRSWSMIPALATVAVATGLAASTAFAGQPGANDTTLAFASPANHSLVVTTADVHRIASVDVQRAGLWQVGNWLDTGSERVPALMLILTMLLAVPPLALAGMVVGRRRRLLAPVATARSRLFRRAARAPAHTTQRTYISSWPTEAWVHLEGAPASRWVIGRSLVRIGQEEDNDIRMASHSVHRYHAVIRRTTDGDVVINDLSGANGAGVLVNGERIEEARLKEGDAIQVGAIRLRFDARPV